MRALDLKLWRDLRRLWPQALAIAFVMAAGVATMILGVGAHAALESSRTSYYAQNDFADVFARLTRAPRALLPEIEAIPGVAAVEGRIEEIALADMPGMAEPASVLLVSIPDHRASALNRIHLRTGRMPDPEAADEVVAAAGFAAAHALAESGSIEVLINGRKRALRVVGTAISPDFVYALGPGALMPDDRRFGILWVPERVLAPAYDLAGAFNAVSVGLVPGADARAVIDRLDALLDRHGGRGAHGRADQVSHAFLDAELQQLRAMSRVLPPIFLIVSAFLVNMTLSRLIALERRQIGLLKAMGYGSGAVMAHYAGFAGVIALGGIAIGSVAGGWLGARLALVYAEFFSFPVLIFSRDPAIYAIGAGTTLAAALLGAARAVREVARLAPAVAMQPPAPPRYRPLAGAAERLLRGARQSVRVVARHLTHAPLRTLNGVVGIALAVGILVGSLWSFGSIDHLVDVTFHRSDRQDATLTLAGPRAGAVLGDIARLPGVIEAEPFRAVAAILRSGPAKRRVALMGLPAGATLSRVLDARLAPVALPPEGGVVLSAALARVLGVGRGDTVEIVLLEGRRETLLQPVAAVVTGYIGLGAYMDIDALGALLREPGVISGAHLALDPAARADLFARLKQTPGAGFVALQYAGLAMFRETLARNVTMMISVYVTLAGIIAFGVVYNFARVSLSEQAREMASLRVLGFTRGEVSALLLGELAVVVALAQPLGWAIGYGFAAAMAEGFRTDLYRVPLVVGREVYATATLVVLGAATVSALVVRRRIDRLDMIAVLKTAD
jgi:putative ABC transport system permease protein